MTAGSDLVFDHLSHNHIEPRAEYQFFLGVLLVHSELSLDERNLIILHTLFFKKKYKFTQ